MILQFAFSTVLHFHNTVVFTFLTNIWHLSPPQWFTALCTTCGLVTTTATPTLLFSLDFSCCQVRHQHHLITSCYVFLWVAWVKHSNVYFPLYFLFCFPGWGPQWLSYLWYLSDGRIRRRSLTWTHILHLGIFKRLVLFSPRTVFNFRFLIVLSFNLLPPYFCRLWECMTLPDMDVYGEIMQQADASALRLFEALVVTLPQTLLQTYVLICTDIGVKSPGSHRGTQKC